MKSKIPIATRTEILVAMIVIGALAVLLFPALTGACSWSTGGTEALQQTKGIFYGLKMFATDHNGRFPSVLEEDFDTTGTPGPVLDANHAFANLIPKYVQSELPFFDADSPYCQTADGKPFTPNNTPPADRTKILLPGHNHWAYVRGLDDLSDPNSPIIADGFAGGPGPVTNPVHSKTKGQYGAIAEDLGSIVIRCDGSAVLSPVDQASLTIHRTSVPSANLLAIRN